MDVGRNEEMGRGKGKGKALHSCDKKRRKIRRKGLGWWDRKGGDDKAFHHPHCSKEKNEITAPVPRAYTFYM